MIPVAFGFALDHAKARADKLDPRVKGRADRIAVLRMGRNFRSYTCKRRTSWRRVHDYRWGLNVWVRRKRKQPDTAA
jgi:hypothetical protein